MSATNRGAIRVPHDAYYTPESAITPLLIKLQGASIPDNPTILEPCAGPGSLLIRRLRDQYPAANISEFDIQSGQDFLSPSVEGRWDLCITNPPYSLAQEFVTKILDTCFSAAILLRLNFLGSQRRKPWWQGRTPDKLLVLSKRPSFVYGRTDATEYAWFCWGDAFAHCNNIEVL